MIKFRFTLSIALLSLFFTSYAHKLNFNSEGEFTVLQFSDFHYGYEEHDAKTQQLQREMIARVKPDLIVVSGDGVSGYKGYYYGAIHRPQFFKKNWKKFTDPIAEAGIPYAFTIGNHDVDADLDRYEIAKLDMTHPWSVRKTSEGIPNTLNFHIPIYSSHDQSKLALNIWLFDTGRQGCMGHEDSWGCVQEHQIQWYEQESKKIKAQHGTDIHHIAFQHIPMPEFMMLSDENEIYGRKGEAVCCPNVNSGFFDRVKASNDISGIFVGHDHFNNYGGWYNGIELVYCQKSGYGNYGDIRGARVIKFQENPDANGKLNVKREHYVIYEDGTVDKSKTMHFYEGAKQRQCPSAGFDTTIQKLVDARFFDYLVLAGAILFLLVGICLFRKVMSIFKNKQSDFDELTDDEAPQEESHGTHEKDGEHDEDEVQV